LSANGLIESSSRSPFFTAHPEDIGGTPKGPRVPVKGSAGNVPSGTCNSYVKEKKTVSLMKITTK